MIAFSTETPSSNTRTRKLWYPLLEDSKDSFLREVSLNLWVKTHSLASGKEGQFSDTDKKTAENFGIDYMDVDDFVRYWEN